MIQAVAWAVISLLRNLLVFDIDPIAVAFQISVIVVALPIFLAHWADVRRVVEKDEGERLATFRSFYLYGNLTLFLWPILTCISDLLDHLMGGGERSFNYYFSILSTGEAIIYNLTAIVIFAILYAYHQHIINQDAAVVSVTEGAATVRRVFVYGFSFIGLTMITMSVIRLIRWLMIETGIQASYIGSMDYVFQDEIRRLLIGVPLWVIFWRWAQRLFDGPNEEERESALRKFYLLGVIFIAALSVVAYSTGILSNLIRRLLDVVSETSLDDALPVIIGMGVVWAYHAFVLREDTNIGEDSPRQAGVRRAYAYLIAGIGLAALLGGLSGTINVILEVLGSSFGNILREMLSWFTALIISGLSVWLLTWRRAQLTANSAKPEGSIARRSLSRRIYVYFFIFVSILVALSCAVYLVFRILSTILGEDPPAFTELAEAISYGVIAVGVLIYHGRILRNDADLDHRDQIAQLEGLRVVLVDVGEVILGGEVFNRLKGEFPNLELESIVLASPESREEGMQEDYKTLVKQIEDASLIIGPWTIACVGGPVDQQIMEAIAASPARKLIIPASVGLWGWIGIGELQPKDIIKQTVRTIRQILSGEEIKIHRSLGVGWGIAIAVVTLFVIFFLVAPFILSFLMGGLF
jgi:hypothetical protein